MEEQKEKKKVKLKWLKIKGKGLLFNIEQALEHDTTYPIAFNIDIVDIQTPTNHDGSIDLVYIGESTGEFNIYKDKSRKTVFIKVDKRSDSQLLRGQIINTCKKDIPLADHYHERMIKLRHFWYLVDKYIDELDKKEQAGKL